MFNDINIVEPNGNWKTFFEAKDDDYILLQHVTSVKNADSIMKEGFQQKDINWKDSEKGFVYLLSGDCGMGTYMCHSFNAVVDVLVKKSLLLPDDKSDDWKSYVRNVQNKNEIKRENINLENITAFNTFKLIGQVKAKLSDVTPYRKRSL